MDAVSGNITSVGELDRETTAVFTLTVRASDGAVPEKVRYTDGTVKVVISDVNDNAPSFNTPSIVANVSEDTNIGGVIITLKANDPDEGLNSELRYSITNGNDAGMFTVDSISGEVKVNSSCDLDPEPWPKLIHSLNIFVKDLGTPVSLNTSLVLNISITAANEFTPQLLHGSSFNFSFAENVAVGDGVIVVQVNATDQDYGDQGRVSYAINSGRNKSIRFFLSFQRHIEGCTSKNTVLSLIVGFVVLTTKMVKRHIFSKHLVVPSKGSPITIGPLEVSK